MRCLCLEQASCVPFSPLQRIERLVLWKECEQRRDGSELKPGTYSISTGTKIVPVKKKNISSIKKMTKPHLKNIQKREIDVDQKIKKNTNQPKKPRTIQFYQTISLRKGSCHIWTDLNTDNGEFAFVIEFTCTSNIFFWSFSFHPLANKFRPTKVLVFLSITKRRNCQGTALSLSIRRVA